MFDLTDEVVNNMFTLTITGSPARLSRVLMASAVVVLKHETSTLCQSYNFISIDLTFGVGDYTSRRLYQPCQI